jgi:hypothetical protein
MPFEEINSLYSENRKKSKYTLWKNVELVIINMSGSYM